MADKLEATEPTYAEEATSKSDRELAEETWAMMAAIFDRLQPMFDVLDNPPPMLAAMMPPGTNGNGRDA